MLSEQITRLANAKQDGLREFGFAKVPGHFIGYLLPERIATARVHSLIANDSEIPRFRSNQYENRVLLPGFGHAQSHKLCFGCVHRVGQFLMTDQYAKLTGGFLFGAANRGDDVVVLELV